MPDMEIPIESYVPDMAVENPLVLVFQDDARLPDLPDIFAGLIAGGVYPLSKGIPFCNGDVQHMVETYGKSVNSSHDPQCAGCLMKQWCCYKGHGFSVKPILQIDPDLEKWLNDENTIAFV